MKTKYKTNNTGYNVIAINHKNSRATFIRGYKVHVWWSVRIKIMSQSLCSNTLILQQRFLNKSDTLILPLYPSNTESTMGRAVRL